MLKGFMDGSLGSRTAALKAPYSDDPTNSGLPRFDQKTLDKMAIERAEAGYQLGFHAIGDRANDMALTAFERAQQARMKLLTSILPQLQSAAHANITVTDTSRYRIEHAQVVSPGDFDRFEKLHVIASMQPSHLLTDMNWAAARLGPDRAKYSYAWRSFLDHHVTLAFGTDYPVESINPFRGLYSAVTRMNEAGTMTYQPQEKITLPEAVYAYTQASAFAEIRRKDQGPPRTRLLRRLHRPRPRHHQSHPARTPPHQSPQDHSQRRNRLHRLTHRHPRRKLHSTPP